MRNHFSQVGVMVLAAAVICGCSKAPAPGPSETYVTEYGLGPDKWATAWLLTRRPGVQSPLKVTEPGAVVAEGIAFDVPHAPIRRLQSRSAFEVARDSLGLRDPTLDRLADIVHEIEVNYWSAEGPPEADVVENAYRELQRKHGRDQVSADCYVAFFDRVYDVLSDVQRRGIPFDADRLSMSCDELVHVARRQDELVPEVPVADVLSAMAAGRRVVFVDVREADEFAEAHIPGALNIPLRDAGPQWVSRFRGADYVVSYCVKDFRGFEMAKALANAGVAHSVIMRPYGIKGWAALGLPVTGERGMTEEAARKDLNDCLSAHGECLMQRAVQVAPI